VSRDRIAARVRSLADAGLAEVVAHGGEGSIGFRRVFDRADFAGPLHFVDYAVLPPGASIGRHTHGRDEELYLVLEGSGTMHLDGQEFRVGPGSVILNRAGGTHGLRNDSDAPLRLFVVEVGLGRPGETDLGAPGDGGADHD
jgi:mannose-6-phosphate isomerase-like protein (cupin superfamily)